MKTDNNYNDLLFKLNSFRAITGWSEEEFLPISEKVYLRTRDILDIAKCPSNIEYTGRNSVQFESTTGNKHYGIEVFSTKVTLTSLIGTTKTVRDVTELIPVIDFCDSYF